jgi:hypothetical protein
MNMSAIFMCLELHFVKKRTVDQLNFSTRPNI